MDRKIGRISALVNICAVAGFAVCLPFGFLFGDYLASMFIAFSFVPLMCAYAAAGKPEGKAVGFVSVAFAAMYAVVILLVYFAQVTTVRLAPLTEQAATLLDYSAFGLFFNYDLLGYCFMALSTFFAGLTIDAKTKPDRVLKGLLIIHGIFAVSCFLLPILGVFNADMEGAFWIGTGIMLFWCLYFIPVGVLSYLHFRGDGQHRN